MFVRRRLRYFIALGSNVGDRESSLRAGWAALGRWGSDMRLSSLYETQPMYVADQPLYLNAVGEVASSLQPGRMLSVLQRIEKSLGRNRPGETRMGPRTLDLDILLCGNTIMDTGKLMIPHPRIKERLFVLVPLLELAPNLADPRTGEPYSIFLEALEAAVDSSKPGPIRRFSS